MAVTADADVSGGGVIGADETMRYRLASFSSYAMPMRLGYSSVSVLDENCSLASLFLLSLFVPQVFSGTELTSVSRVAARTGPPSMAGTRVVIEEWRSHYNSDGARTFLSAVWEKLEPWVSP